MANLDTDRVNIRFAFMKYVTDLTLKIILGNAIGNTQDIPEIPSWDIVRLLNIFFQP